MSPENAMEQQVTVESIRAELRSAIHGSHFGVSIAEVSQDKVGAEQKRQQTAAFAQFGVRSKLISIEEGNDILDMVFRGKCSVEVEDKWEGRSPT